MTHKISMDRLRRRREPRRSTPRTTSGRTSRASSTTTRASTGPEDRGAGAALLNRGLESPYGDWLKRVGASSRAGVERTLTTHVPCAEFYEIRDKALIAHATQIDPDGGWFRVPMDIQKEVWPTEEYELARSRGGRHLPPRGRPLRGGEGEGEPVTVLASASTSLLDQPGTLGFLVIFGMGVVLYFVFGSMARHLRKVNTAAREEAAAAASAQKATAGARSEDQNSR